MFYRLCGQIRLLKQAAPAIFFRSSSDHPEVKQQSKRSGRQREAVLMATNSFIVRKYVILRDYAAPPIKPGTTPDEVSSWTLPTRIATRRRPCKT
jgi:hypothetical protein